MYDITCTGLSDGGYMIEDPNQIHQVVRTTDAEFHIEKAILKDQKVEVTLRSNLEIPVLCLLFNNKGMNICLNSIVGLKIESKVYDSTKAQSVSFIVSSMKHDYRVQCNAFNNDNKGMYKNGLRVSVCINTICPGSKSPCYMDQKAICGFITCDDSYCYCFCYCMETKE